jgi:hypothetical protein
MKTPQQNVGERHAVPGPRSQYGHYEVRAEHRRNFLNQIPSPERAVRVQRQPKEPAIQNAPFLAPARAAIPVAPRYPAHIT